MSINLPLVTNRVTTWDALKGKPYITVSAKGISNGQSTIINDGADFGPDTMLGATSNDQYGQPYTQTAGIQEALNYLINNYGGGTVYLEEGIYTINWTSQMDEQGYAIGIGNAPNGLKIIGSGSSNTGKLYDGGYIIGNSTDFNGTMIYLKFPSNSYAFSVYFSSGFIIFPESNSGLPNSIAQNQIYIDGIDFTTNLTSTGNVFDLLNLAEASSIYLGTVNIFVMDATSSELTSTSNTWGLVTPTTANQGNNVIEKLYVAGFEFGIYLNGGHISATAIYIDTCKYAFQTEAYSHYSHIMYCNIQYTTAFFYESNPSNVSTPYMSFQIDVLDTEIVAPGGGFAYQLSEFATGNYTVNGNLTIYPINGKIRFWQPESLAFPYSQVVTNLPDGMELEFIGALGESVVNGTTAGTVKMKWLTYSNSYKKLVIIFTGYENDTTTDQIIQFAPLNFPNHSGITLNNTTGLSINQNALNAITITAPDNTTTYSGIVIVEGY